jgi:hypothetical protein
MFEPYLHKAFLLLLAGLFGGMLLFSAGFAAFLFKHLPPTDARMLIRKAFPPFYLFVIVTSGLAMGLSWDVNFFNTIWMGVILLTAVGARQVLMPAINQATDKGLKKRFFWLHGLSVLLTLGHIVVTAYVLVR